MKKIVSKKIIALLIGAFAVGAGGTVFYKSNTEEFNKDQNSQIEQEKATDEETSGEKTDELGKDQGGQDNDGVEDSDKESDKKDQVPARPPTDGASSLASLGTSVMARSSDDTISVWFYVEDSGTFTIQEKSGSSWKTTTENIFYKGSGGLLTAKLSSAQSSKTIRVLKNQNGKYVSVTKSFTIKRSEVEAAPEGVKTYN